MIKRLNNRASFKIIQDPRAYPLSSHSPLSQFEVYWGLRLNSFVDGTIIEDRSRGTQHRVVVKKCFVPYPNNGLAVYHESKLVPPHPKINDNACFPQAPTNGEY